jgi:hypothetical protein
MSICPISNEYDFTFTGVRADDGGQPEELIAVVNRYGYEGDFSVEPYDTRVDNDFTFIGYEDGVYRFELTGGVSGLVMAVDFLVNHNAETSVSQLLKDDVDNIICGGCDQGEAYLLTRSLLYSADALNKIDLVLKSGCGTKLCGGGC